MGMLIRKIHAKIPKLYKMSVRVMILLASLENEIIENAGLKIIAAIHA